MQSRARWPKTCTKCGSHGPFYKDRTKRDGFHSECKACTHELIYARPISPAQRHRKNETTRAWRRKHPKLLRDYQLRVLYGLTYAQFEQLLKKQRGRCAICRRALNFKTGAVDHDHKTGKIRGILCIKCNTGLGMFQDSRRLCLAAVRYLGHKRGK